MHISMKAKVYLPLLALVMLVLLAACSRPATPPLVPEKPPVTPVPSPLSQTAQSARVEVYYFHMPQRCISCVCFEERIDYVVKTYFQNEVNTGKLVFQIIELGDKRYADVARKYNAVGSQLFVNMIRDGEERIVDIQDIWKWRCAADKPGFDAKVRNFIEYSLGEVK